MDNSYFVNTAIGIKDEVLRLIGDDLGSYFYSNNKTTKAISVLEQTPANWPPPGTRIEGIEAIIIYPEIKTEFYLRSAVCRMDWTVIINQRSGKQTLNILLIKLLELSYNVSSQISIPEIKEKGIPEMLKLIITEYL